MWQSKENVMMDLPNVDDVSNAVASVPKASVSTSDVCNRIKKNLTGFEKKKITPRMSCQRDYTLRISVLFFISYINDFNIALDLESILLADDSLFQTKI